jgi:hypothetical protein
MVANAPAVGASDGSIIAAIITAQAPVNHPSVPRRVPGPASIPAIRSAVTQRDARRGQQTAERQRF